MGRNGNGRGFSAEQVARIVELNSEGYNDTNIAEIVGATYRRVSRWRKGSGLPQNSPYTEMSTKKKRKTMRETLRRDTLGMMNYRNMAHYLSAIKLGWPGYKLGEALIMHVLENEGELETPELLGRINFKKALKGWRPKTTLNMMFHYMAPLREEGLVERVYPRGKNWRSGHRLYYLTDEARNRAIELRKGCRKERSVVGVNGCPTWRIGGQNYEETLSLERLGMVD